MERESLMTTTYSTSLQVARTFVVDWQGVMEQKRQGRLKDKAIAAEAIYAYLGTNRMP